jgi:hypothetical protein
MNAVHAILGCHVVDRVTGFKGVAVGHVEYMTGCNQTLVVPAIAADGTLREGQWFDDQRLQLTVGERIRLDNSETPGHDIPPPRRY